MNPVWVGLRVYALTGNPFHLENNMSKLTRKGARNLTASIDRIASTIQENAALLGINTKIAKDFAYRCDLISDAVETTAVTNYPKAATESPADDIGKEVSGPLVDGEVEKDSAGHFTQNEFSELTDVAEKLASAASALAKITPKTAAINDHGFGLIK